MWAALAEPTRARLVRGVLHGASDEDLLHYFGRRGVDADEVAGGFDHVWFWDGEPCALSYARQYPAGTYIGYFVRRGYRRRGVASRIVRFYMVRHEGETLLATVHVTNKASACVLRRHGFKAATFTFGSQVLFTLK